MRHAAAKALALFRGFSVREKLLLLVFVAVMLLLWSGSLMGRLSTLRADLRQAGTDLSTQEEWLSRADEYSQGLQQALERVDPSKTYSAAQLSGRVDAMLRQVNLAGAADIDPVRTRTGEIFNDHDLRVRLNRISIADLIEFNKLLGSETPYINLETVRLSANRRKPEELDARFEVNSFELKNQNL